MNWLMKIYHSFDSALISGFVASQGHWEVNLIDEVLAILSITLPGRVSAETIRGNGQVRVYLGFLARAQCHGVDIQCGSVRTDRSTSSNIEALDLIVDHVASGLVMRKRQVWSTPIG